MTGRHASFQGASFGLTRPTIFRRASLVATIAVVVLWAGVAPAFAQGGDGSDNGGTLLAAWLLGLEGLVLAGMGIFFIFVRPALLPEDLHFLQQQEKEIDTAVPRLRRWLRHVFVVLGGHALSAGLLTIFVAATAVRNGDQTAVAVLAAAGGGSVALMTAVNFSIRSQFRWLLLVVVGLWLAGLIAALLS